MSLLETPRVWDAGVCVVLVVIAYAAALCAVDMLGIARFHNRFVAFMRDEQEPRVAQACVLLEVYQTWAERRAAGRTWLDAFYMQLFEAELALCRFVVYSYMPFCKTQAEVLRVFYNFCGLVRVAPNDAGEPWKSVLGRGVERLAARNPLRRRTYAFYCGLACRQNAPPTFMMFAADTEAACRANAAISAAGSRPSDSNV